MTGAAGSEDGIGELKEWFVKQKHLPRRIEDGLARRFLACCDGDVSRAKSLVELSYGVRARAPEIFSRRDPSEPQLAAVLEHSDTIPLPGTTEQNHKLILFRAVRDPGRFAFADVLKTVLMVADVRLAFDPEVTDGEIPIFDCTGLSLQHLTSISFPTLRKYMAYTQEAHPVRLKQIHVINVSPFVDRLTSLVRPLMTRHVADTIKFHVSVESLARYVDIKMLPEEYGGKNGKLSDLKARVLAEVHNRRDYLTDESLWKVS